MSIFTFYIYQFPQPHFKTLWFIKIGVKKNCMKSIVSSIEVKWITRCDIHNMGCPVGISDLMTLPYKVKTAQWHCFCGNVRHLLAVLGQSNDHIAAITFLHWQGTEIWDVQKVIWFVNCLGAFLDVGCHTFLLPSEMDFENLSYQAHLMKLPVLV